MIRLPRVETVFEAFPVAKYNRLNLGEYLIVAVGVRFEVNVFEYRKIVNPRFLFTRFGFQHGGDEYLFKLFFNECRNATADFKRSAIAVIRENDLEGFQQDLRRQFARFVMLQNGRRIIIRVRKKVKHAVAHVEHFNRANVTATLTIGKQVFEFPLEVPLDVLVENRRFLRQIPTLAPPCQLLELEQGEGLPEHYNIDQDAPSQKRYGTQKNRRWLEQLELPLNDRTEVDIHLKLWKEYDERILSVESELAKCYEGNPAIMRLTSVPGISVMGAITLLSRVGDITRFKTPDSLANYFGLTPGCRNSGESKHRIGSITRAGSRMARYVLNHAVNHAVRKCPDMKNWHKKIKTRRGSKTARVAVMRRLATIVWHILRWEVAYQFRYDPPVATKKHGNRHTSTKVFLRGGNKNHGNEKTPSTRRNKSKA